MSGWTRLKIVLSALYWMAALGLILSEGGLIVESLACAAVPYVVLAAIWWALEGFGRQGAS